MKICMQIYTQQIQYLPVFVHVFLFILWLSTEKTFRSSGKFWYMELQQIWKHRLIMQQKKRKTRQKQQSGKFYHDYVDMHMALNRIYPCCMHVQFSDLG